MTTPNRRYVCFYVGKYVVRVRRLQAALQGADLGDAFGVVVYLSAVASDVLLALFAAVRRCCCAETAEFIFIAFCRRRRVLRCGCGVLAVPSFRLP